MQVPRTHRPPSITESRSRERAEHRAPSPGVRTQPVRLALKNKGRLNVLGRAARTGVFNDSRGRWRAGVRTAEQGGPASQWAVLLRAPLMGAEGLRKISPTSERGLRELPNPRPLPQLPVFERIWPYFAALRLGKPRPFSTVRS